MLVHAERWPGAPGARWVNYTRPEGEWSSPEPAAEIQPPVAHLVLDGPVLPLLTDNLAVGEAARRAIGSVLLYARDPDSVFAPLDTPSRDLLFGPREAIAILRSPMPVEGGLPGWH